MAGNSAKLITGMRIDTAAQKAVAQYGYFPKAARHRGLGAGAHYVYPDIFANNGANVDNGLQRGTGLALGAGITHTSQFLDITGWCRWALYFNFPVAFAGGGSVGFTCFADPAFNNALVTPPGLGIGAGAVQLTFDSQAFGTPFTPYIQFYINNAGGAGPTYTCSMFLFDYLYK